MDKGTQKQLEQLKQKYMDTPIPEELDFIIEKSIKHGRENIRRNNIKKLKILSTSVAAVIILVIIGINTSPVLAQNLSELPIVGGIIKILIFQEYTLDEGDYKANIQVPEIQGLENKDLEKHLNEKYFAEGKELYNEFMEAIEVLEEIDEGHLGVEGGYIVKTDTDKILSIGRYVVNTVGSSPTVFKFDTIDKEKEILITLPSLFKDNTYIGIISDNIRHQMEERMKLGEYNLYWLEEDSMSPFKEILQEQGFYINPQGKLVISFDKYEVAPGHMGNPEFVIPTEIIDEILVGNEYIQ